jgi:hypothetical protein
LILAEGGAFRQRLAHGFDAEDEPAMPIEETAEERGK